MASLTDRMIRAARLDVKLYEEVEADESTMSQAMTVVALSSLAAGIGVVRAGILPLLGTLVAAFVGWFVWALLTYVIGVKLLPEPQTKSDIGELLRTIGFASSPGVLRIFGIIPILGTIISFAAGVWMLVAVVVAVRQTLDYQSTGRAVIVCLLGWLVYMGAMIVVGFLGALATAFT